MFHRHANDEAWFCEAPVALYHDSLVMFDEYVTIPMWGWCLVFAEVVDLGLIL